MRDLENQRAAFEAHFSTPPFEWEFHRYGEQSAWPGNYQNYDHQCAWEAWKAALASPEVQALRKDAERLNGLIEMCGHLQDGSDSVVRIFQDDATCKWIVRVGDPMNGSVFHGSSPKAAIDAAMEKQK